MDGRGGGEGAASTERHGYVYGCVSGDRGVMKWGRGVFPLALVALSKSSNSAFPGKGKTKAGLVN